MPRTRVLERVQTVPRSLEHVFDFFSNAANLARLSPPFVRFEIKTPEPITMQAGTVIEYRIRVHGIPLGWRTRIEEYTPRARFVDEQIAGPYRAWRHEHEFARVPGGTEIRDRVTYQMRFSLLGDIAHALFVARDLRRIFDYRAAAIERWMGSAPISHLPS
ncbi:MAG: SRPBCC family protein [Planctomycetota bacterium]